MNKQFGIELEISGITREKAHKALKAVGVKVELENYNHDTKDYWKIVPDGSLENGFEVVSPILKGEAGLEKVEIVARALEDAGVSANRTCGFHVHFDFRDINLPAIKNVVRRYAKFEEQIDAFMPFSRRGNTNQYCLSTKGLIDEGFESAGTMSCLAYHQPSRYYKINLKAFQRYGTIEFRHHSGTINSSKICAWIRFLSEFIDVSGKEQNGPLEENSAPRVANSLARFLTRETPVGLEEICEKFNWLPHTARSALSRLRSGGYGLETCKLNGKTHYRIASETDSLWRGISAKIAQFYKRRAAVLAVAA